MKPEEIKGKTIQPIETEYKGYRFRSRLEARWAVFFDTAGIPWDYEPEGYELSTGERYLPDFYLPNERLFVEIKGVSPTKEYLQMLGNFAIGMETSVLLLVGQYDEGEQWIFGFNELEVKFDVDETTGETIYEESKEYVWKKVKIYVNPFQKKYAKLNVASLLCYEVDEKITNFNHVNGSPLDTFCTYHEEMDWLDIQLRVELDKIRESDHAMKQARFEHGEKPQIRNIEPKLPEPKPKRKAKAKPQAPEGEITLEEEFYYIISLYPVNKRLGDILYYEKTRKQVSFEEIEKRVKEYTAHCKKNNIKGAKVKRFQKWITEEIWVEDSQQPPENG